MATSTTDDWTAAPYAPWLGEVIQTMVASNPVSIAMCMIDENGLVSTCYYDTSPNDRACMIDAMRDDARWAFIRDNRDEIMALLNDEDDDEDELQDPDTDADCEEPT